MSDAGSAARSRLRVGMVGAGSISGVHAAAWRSLGAELYVYAFEGASLLVSRFGATECGSFAELLERVDIVDIVTPTDTHADFVRGALERGKSVVSEKPLARTAAEAGALSRLAAERGLPLFPAHVVRYMEPYAALKRQVDAGVLGETAVARFWRRSASPLVAWFHDEARSGGIVMDLMIHDLDIARWTLGEVVRVSATQRTVVDEAHSLTGRAMPMAAASVMLEHENGAVSWVRGSWASPEVQFAYGFSVAGSGGRVEFDSSRDVDRTDIAPRSEHGNYVPGHRNASDSDAAAAIGSRMISDAIYSPYASELRDFAMEIVTPSLPGSSGAGPRMSAEDGVAAVALAEAALRSIETGQPVEVEHPRQVAEGNAL